MNMDTDRPRYDVVVMGGGPAGAAASTFLAQYGYDVLLLEKETFPREHIGESLMPETYWPFERLGIIPKLKKTVYPRKYSVQFFSQTGKASRPFYFYETNDHDSAVTWQVPRPEFDAMLLENGSQGGLSHFL